MENLSDRSEIRHELISKSEEDMTCTQRVISAYKITLIAQGVDVDLVLLTLKTVHECSQNISIINVPNNNTTDTDTDSLTVLDEIVEILETDSITNRNIESQDNNIVTGVYEIQSDG